MAVRSRYQDLAEDMYQYLRGNYGYSHEDAVIRCHDEYHIWLDPKVKIEEETRRYLKEENKRRQQEEAEAKRQQALVEVKEKAAVMEAKVYILIKAEEQAVEYLTQKELNTILEDPEVYGITEFLTAADVLKGLGNQMLWRKGQAMLAKFEIQKPKPKEKSWTLPQE